MIVTVLSPELARRLSDAWPDGIVSVGTDAIGAKAWWRAVPLGALIVLDPTFIAGDGVALELASGALADACARVVFYTSFSPESMRAVAFAAALRPTELWIAGVDDRAQEFGLRMRRLAARGTVNEVLARLDDSQARLPHPVRAAVTAVFRAPERFFDAADVARAAATSRRSLDRHLVASGLTTARRLIVGAKMLHGAVRLRGAAGAPRSVQLVSDSLGFSGPKVFGRQFGEVFGVPPSAGATLDPQGLVCAVVHYVRPADQPSRAVPLQASREMALT